MKKIERDHLYFGVLQIEKKDKCFCFHLPSPIASLCVKLTFMEFYKFCQLLAFCTLNGNILRG